MNRANSLLIALCVLLLLTNAWLLYERLGLPAEAEAGPAPDAEAPELAEYMASLQRYSHKLGLSVEARNTAAADFYLHELEEMSETIVDEVPRYEGHAVGELTATMLVPTVEAVEKALAGEDWDRVDTRFDEMVQACNQCHVSTEHGFIQIEADVQENPFNQSFVPAEKQ